METCLLVLAALWLVDVRLTRALFGTGVGQPIAAADRIEVHTDKGHATSTVTDPAAIARVLAFVDARPGRWQKSWHTPPVDRVHVIFYEGGEVRGWFASGNGFFQAPAPDGQAAMRNAKDAELEDLNRLLGLPPETHLGVR